MEILTPKAIVDAIAPLQNKVLKYFSSSGTLRITRINFQEGPIEFVRGVDNSSVQRITQQQIAKIALICSSNPNFPLHIDRIFSAGGNTRSALETMLIHTPHFFVCFPQRIDVYSGEIVTNLKHFMWCPEDTHVLGETLIKPYDKIISEVETGIDFGQIEASPENAFDSIEAGRVHAQIQYALVEIGRAMAFSVWIARNDRGIKVKGIPLGQIPGVLQSLNDIPLFYRQEIREAATLIDCIWFTADGDYIPAIIEIEHSTGVTSGLTRMLKLHKLSPSLNKTFMIVAPNHLREKVVREANGMAFRDLNVKYMSYSTVRELFGLVQKYQLTGVVDHRFVNAFMETIVNR